MTIFIMTILMLMSVPAATTLWHNQQSRLRADRVLAALHYTRSEAIKRNTIVSFCASLDSQKCGGEWRDGQIVIVENSGVVLRRFSALSHPEILSYRGNFGLNDRIRYTAIGFTHGQSGRFFYTQDNSEMNWEIIVNQSGRARLRG